MKPFAPLSPLEVSSTFFPSPESALPTRALSSAAHGLRTPTWSQQSPDTLCQPLLATVLPVEAFLFCYIAPTQQSADSCSQKHHSHRTAFRSGPQRGVRFLRHSMEDHNRLNWFHTCANWKKVSAQRCEYTARLVPVSLVPLGRSLNCSFDMGHWILLRSVSVDSNS